MIGQDRRRAELGPPADETGGWLTIDLGALARNWRLLAEQAGAARCAAVIKADAYGTGIEATALYLSRAGCDTFFVAHLSEGKRVRAAAPAAIIYVLNGLLPGTGPIYGEHRLRPVLGSVPEIVEWIAFVKSAGTGGEAAVHVDTGMNRLGLRPPEAIQLLLQYPGGLGFPVSLLMSHFVAAEDRGNPVTERQIQLFAQVKRMFPDVPASLANSSGIFLGPHAAFDLVRPGYALYGGNPTPGRLNPMAGVVTLEGRILQVRQVGDRETVGYSGTWTARGPRRIATIGIGYADGFARALGGTDATPGTEALVAGKRCPLVGRVSMDLLAVDITAVAEDAAGRGDPVTLMGGSLDIDSVAAKAGTIGYELLTRLGRRYRRVYLGG
jgi:alanine racemase